MPSRSMDSSSTIKILYILHPLCLILSIVFFLFTFKYTVCAKLFKTFLLIMYIFQTGISRFLVHSETHPVFIPFLMLTLTKYSIIITS